MREARRELKRDGTVRGEKEDNKVGSQVKIISAKSVVSNRGHNS